MIRYGSMYQQLSWGEEVEEARAQLCQVLCKCLLSGVGAFMKIACCHHLCAKAVSKVSWVLHEASYQRPSSLAFLIS